jgi:hypothetical protein
MGMYLNPGMQSFEMGINSEIYVDKTEMMTVLNALVNTNKRYVSVSRPRRFGKTMAADMICAYYDRSADGRALFEGTRLAASDPVPTGRGELAWDGYLGKFDVVRLVMTDFFKVGRPVGAGLAMLARRVLGELSEAYPQVGYDGDDLPYSMGRFYQATGTQFVIVIDEWDAVFRQRQDDKDGQREFLDFLRDWLKDRPYVALAYMTGILPIKKYGQHSALNMFTEYSMMSPRRLARYAGFTEDEVRGLCDRYGRDFGAMRDWYDGYEVSDVVPADPGREGLAADRRPEARRYALYSPLSVVEAVTTGVIRDYWNQTETYEALADYIRRDYDGLKGAVALLMDGGRLRIDASTYQNDMTTFYGRDDVLALLVHLGYLGYDAATCEVFVPNREVLDEFRASTKSREWEGPLRAYERSKDLLRATWDRDAGRVAALLEEAHDRAANRTYNDEAALSYAVQLAYYAAQKYYTEVLELDSGKGYADICYLPSPKHPELPALVVELKHGRPSETALEQIRRRNYPDRLEHYRGNTLLVAVSYDRDARSTDPAFKRHSCVIEEA